jgi:hypothetical protein
MSANECLLPVETGLAIWAKNYISRGAVAL